MYMHRSDETHLHQNPRAAIKVLLCNECNLLYNDNQEQDRKCYLAQRKIICISGMFSLSQCMPQSKKGKERKGRQCKIKGERLPKAR